jgi:PAB-dependent poly(A)-specific ribonuclease subunit 3
LGLIYQLDAGTDEKLMLVARDEQSCLVVSYKDIKTCIANAFECVFSLGKYSLAMF